MTNIVRRDMKCLEAEKDLIGEDVELAEELEKEQYGGTDEDLIPSPAYK